MTVRQSAFAAVVATALIAVGCGGGEGSATTQSTTSSSSTSNVSADGKQLFVENCSSCHQLAAAESAGVTGPNLDERKPDAGEVVDKVHDGGGGMPSFEGRLTDAQIEALADFVSQNAGQ